MPIPNENFAIVYGDGSGMGGDWGKIKVTVSGLS